MLKNYYSRYFFLVLTLSFPFANLFAHESLFHTPQIFLRGITLEQLENYSGAFDDLTCKVGKKRKQIEKFNQFTLLLNQLDRLGIRPVVRVVFQRDTDAETYFCVVKKLKEHADIMGLFLDSKALAAYRFKNDPKLNPERIYEQRIDSYLTLLNQYVDIWEVGNEVNGEWADQGCNPNGGEENTDCKKTADKANFPMTINKIRYAINAVKNQSPQKKIALTLIHQPQPDCFAIPQAEMFGWVDRIQEFSGDLDYLLVSYYQNEDPPKPCDTNGNKTVCSASFNSNHPNKPESDFCLGITDKDEPRRYYWKGLFNWLHNKISDANKEKGINRDVAIGFGEVGCEAKSNCASRTDLVKRYYNIRPKEDWFIGGYFWWSAQTDLLNSDFLETLKKNL